MKISLFSLVLKDLPLEEVMKVAREIGYEGIELCGQEPHISTEISIERAKEIRRALDYYELEVPSIGSYIGGFSTKSDIECKKEFEELEKFLDIMPILGCNMLRIAPGGPNAFLATKYHYEKSLYWMAKCADLAKMHNVRIAMEIHNGSLIETVEAAKAYVEQLNRDNVGLIHDAGNMYITDTDYGIESVQKLGEQIYHIHVKDELRVEEDTLPGAFHSRTIYGDEIFQQKFLGTGAVDHVPLFKALLRNGYNGYISIECHVPVLGIERAKREFEEVKNLIEIARESL
ncbi:sugar phosphate isomerase/epimerase family protein [Xylanivirga thermophila]|uniref:sugar phosphate isomerase/epimerase family protein n=1 Tax=Xylanivirga thermophila TaxID=2496273 RepID=UPI00101BDE69|nr:sugar phosphate isomerase/epimerase [Xylanivirga thermophila]